MLTRYLIDGQTVSLQNIKPLEVTVPTWVWPLVAGLILGAFIWTPLGRKIAVSPIAKGAQVSERKVEEWLKKGEK